MNREWLLLLTSTTLTVVLAVGLIRWFAPQLLGIPIDLQMVQVSEEIPPFFDGVFRWEDYQTKEFIIKDPYVKRAKPLHADIITLGPHDLLGFRNRHIPNVADIVFIGDSQTYGNNAVLEKNWPQQLEAYVEEKARPVTYSMAVGGWGAIEYLEIFPKATLFQPRVMIVAFYTGNDPLETFRLAYSNNRWNFLRPAVNLNAKDIPSVTFPPPESERWSVAFSDGISTIFTPKLRLISNQPHPAVEAGYAMMAEVARLIGKKANDHDIKMIYTIIPTKELVYAKKVMRERLNAPGDYQTLVEAEKHNLLQLAKTLALIPGATYVDLLEPLQEAALQPMALYPEDSNGHPLASGYGVIAQALVASVKPLLPAKPTGPIGVRSSENSYQVFLVQDAKLWRFSSADTITGNGWNLQEIPVVPRRDIANLKHGGTINEIDPERFGPVSSTNSPDLGQAHWDGEFTAAER